MATEVIGELPCTECGAVSPVKKDKLKYTIPCPDKAECGYMAVYQSKAAKARLLKKLEAATPPAEPEEMPKPDKIVNPDKPDDLEKEWHPDDPDPVPEPEPDPEPKPSVFNPYGFK